MKPEVIYIQNGKNRIYGTMYKPDGTGVFPLVIYSHGYGYNDPIYSMQSLTQNGIAAFRFDFCGGSIGARSDGKSTDMSVLTEVSDLEAVLDAVRELSYIDVNRIYLSGHSQGGYVSTLVGVKRKDEIKGIFLLCPAYIIGEFNRLYGTLHGPTRIGNLLISEKYEADSKKYNIYEEMKKCDIPVTIYHGTNDGMVPIGYSKQAITCFPNASLFEINGAGHIFLGDESELIVRDIANQILNT